MEKQQKIQRKQVKFTLMAEPGHRVFVAGTFNGWNPAEYALKSGLRRSRYVGTFLLPAGRHEYKFIVDGQWQLDSCNPLRVANGVGSFNSVIEV